MNFSGLTDLQVKENRIKYGENKLPDIKLKTGLEFFIEVFYDKMNLILLFIMLVFIFLSILGECSISEPLGVGIVLFLIAGINTRIGLKSQKNMNELRLKLSHHSVNVFRNNKIVKIDESEIVVGDLVLIEMGNYIYADGYLVKGEVFIDNSALNGETASVKKIPLKSKYEYQMGFAHDVNMNEITDSHSLFSGTMVLEGEGVMLITQVGKNTFNGKMACIMTNIKQVKTSLQIQLDDLAKQISKLACISAVFISLILLTIQIIHSGGINEFLSLDIYTILKQLLSILAIAFTIIVAAVPEGLPLIISLITSQNVKNMIKGNVLAKNINKIPEAGNIQLLCTDKTGTLTYGKLSPKYNFLGNGEEIGFKDLPKKIENIFQTTIALNTTAVWVNNKIEGNNTTDIALLKLLGAEKTKIIQVSNEVLDKIPFNSAYKYSASHVKTSSGEYTYCMGAPEILLKSAKNYMDYFGNIQKIDKKFVNKFLNNNMNIGIRFIAIGFSKTKINKETKELPNDITILSFIGLEDIVRTEVPSAVKTMQGAGVQVMMITGDILPTALAIAKETGIIQSSDDLSITASELDNMSDLELKKNLSKIKLIARATPTTKLRIVNISQKLNICCGMCGDGTNDSLALKQADVGFGMGNGTDVCKESSDIIITDSNFVSITNAVLFGRTFMHNIKKFLKFQLPINFSLVLLSLIYPIFFGIEAFSAVQILVINIIMDSLNSLSFGGEPAKSEYMLEKPKVKGEKIISKKTFLDICYSTIIFMGIFSLTMTESFRNLFNSEELYLSARFGLIVLISIINGFNIRTDRINLLNGIFKNPLFIEIALIVFCGIFASINIWGDFFGTKALNLSQWIVLILLSLLIIPFDIFRKVLILKKE